MDLPLAGADFPEINGAGHVAPIPADGGENIEHHAIAGLDDSAVGGVMGIGGVCAEADKLGPFFVRAVFPVSPVDKRGKLRLGASVPQGGDGGFHHPVVDAGGGAQSLPLGLVFIPPGGVKGGGALHRTDIGPFFHQGDKEFTGPEFIDAKPSGADGCRQIRHRIAAVRVAGDREIRRRFHAENCVAEQGGSRRCGRGRARAGARGARSTNR